MLENVGAFTRGEMMTNDDFLERIEVLQSVQMLTCSRARI